MSYSIFSHLARTLFIFSLVTLAVALSPLHSHAEPSTDKSGLITSSETWSVSGSPYIIVGSVRVQNNAVLTIQPGVVVKFKAGTALTIQQGTLIARGTAINPITFTADSSLPQPGHWGFILFNDTSVDATFDGSGNYTGGSILQYATVEYAGKDNVGAVRMEDAAPFIDHNTIRRNLAYGVKGVSTTSRITYNTFENNGSSSFVQAYTIDISQSAATILDHNIIRQSPNGISMSANDSGASNLITNNLIEDSGGDSNQSGIYAVYSSYQQPTVIDGNVIRNNRFQSAIATYSGLVNITNNQIYNNVLSTIISLGYNNACLVSRNIIANNSVPSNAFTQQPLTYLYCSGAVYTSANMTVSHNKIANNSTNGFTAGIYAHGGDIHHNNIVFNNAEDGKVGFHFDCYGTDSKFTYNTIYGQTGDGISTNDNAGGVYVGDPGNTFSGCLPNAFAHNNLFGNQGVQLFNANAQSQPDLKAQQNWWGTTVENQIEDAVHHGVDNASLGFVDTSNALTELDPDAPPPPPVGLAVTIQGSAVVLTWDKTQNRPSDIKGYRVYYDRDSGYPYEGTGAVQGASGFDVGDVDTATITGLPLGKTFYFVVTAYDNDPDPFIAESWYSREIVKRLPAPIKLDVKPGSRTMALSWNATNDPSVTHYRVSRAISGSVTFMGVAPNVISTSYDDADPTLIVGTAYCYKVEALDGDSRTLVTSNLACGVFGKLELWVPDTVGKSGDTVFVPINIRNADGLRIGASDIWLDFNPAIVESIDVSRTALTLDYGWAHGVQSIDANTSRVKISYIHNTGGQPPELHGNGSLFWLNFRVKGADGTNSPLDLREFVKGVGGSAIQNESLTQISLEVNKALLTVKGTATASFIKGDVDGDGVVRAKDAALALQLAAGIRTPTPQEVQAGDINGNGVIQAADASMILYFAGTGKWPPLPGTLLLHAAQVAASTTVKLDDVLGRPGEVVQTTLRATGLNKMAGGDFVVVYDGEVVSSISAVSKSGLAAGFDDLKFQDDGLGRLYIEMADNAEISGDGVLAIIELRLANGAKIGKKAPLLLAEAKLNDLNGRDFVTSFAANTLNRQHAEITVSKLQAGPASFNFIATIAEGNPIAQTLIITGDASTSWNLSSAQSWLGFSQTSGIGSTSVSIQPDISNLTAGMHTAEILIETGNESVLRQVTLILNPAGSQAVLAVSPETLNFSATQGGSNPVGQSIAIENMGSGSMSWNANEAIDWFSLDSMSGIAPSTIIVTVDVSGLSPGSYNEQVQITAGGQSKSVIVALIVNEPNAQPQITLSLNSLAFNAKVGGANSSEQSFLISNSGTGALAWNAHEIMSWLTLSPPSGIAPTTVTVRVDNSNLAVGTYSGNIVITGADAESQAIQVTLNINPGNGDSVPQVYLPMVLR